MTVFSQNINDTSLFSSFLFSIINYFSTHDVDISLNMPVATSSILCTLLCKILNKIIGFLKGYSF